MTPVAELACGYCGQTYALPHDCNAWADIRALEAKVARLQERDDTWKGIAARLLAGWRPLRDAASGELTWYRSDDLTMPEEPMSEAEVQLLREVNDGHA